MAPRCLASGKVDAGSFSEPHNSSVIHPTNFSRNLCCMRVVLERGDDLPAFSL
jgi:hypothetical protein